MNTVGIFLETFFYHEPRYIIMYLGPRYIIMYLGTLCYLCFEFELRSENTNMLMILYII